MMITQIELDRDGTKVAVYHRYDTPSNSWSWTHPYAGRAACVACTDRKLPDAIRRPEKTDSRPRRQKEDATMAKSTKDCACGCEASTKGTFAPGHDMRVKGMIVRGEPIPDAVPAEFIARVRAAKGIDVPDVPALTPHQLRARKGAETRRRNREAAIA